MRRPGFKINYTLFLGVIAGTLLGWMINQCVVADVNKEKQPLKPDKYGALEMFSKVLHLVEQNYVEEVNSPEIIEKAISGMLESLDPHTTYMPPKLYQEMKIETSGKFDGIGTEISIKDKILTVVTPIDDTPAYKAGIEPGDKIIKIYPDQHDKVGFSTKHMSLEKAVNLMRGKRGSKVKLTIWREGFKKPMDYIIMREEIQVASVKSELVEADFGYVRVSQFQENITRDVLKSLKALESKNKKKLRGIILDLRNNPGGLLDEAWKLSDLFIKEGIIVSTIGRDKTNKEIKSATAEGTIEDVSLVVLINGASASASEIVAGALQDHKRALILGQPSFGKGSVQTIMDLGDGSALKLTIARYYTPSGKSIQSHGISPDVYLDKVDYDLYKKAVMPTKWYKEKDLEGHLENEEGEEDTTSTSADEITDAKPEDFSAEELSGLDNQKAVQKAKVTKAEPKDDLWIKQAVSYIKANQLFGKK